MGIIRQLRNYFTKQNIYPQTVEQAIYDTEGRRLDNKLANGVANPNLLINADFRNPVNQREFITTNKSGYIIDRWTAILNNTSYTVSKGNNVITLEKIVGGGYCGMRQYLEFPESYLGKKLTFSIKYNKLIGDAIAYIRLITPSGTIYLGETRLSSDNDLVSVSVEVPTNLSVTSIDFSIYVGKKEVGSTSWTDSQASKLEVEWIKLEEGEIATPFRPRLYAEELQLCKRYYNNFKCKDSFIHFHGNVANSTDIRAIVPFECEMRTVPTMRYNKGTGTQEDGVTVYQFSKGTMEVNNISMLQHTNRQGYLGVSTSGTGLSVDTVAFLRIKGTGYIEFDAEL